MQLLEGGDGRQLILVINANKFTVCVDVLGRVAGSFSHAEGLALGDRRDQAGVETARQQNTVGNLGHQTLADSLLEAVADYLVVNRGRGDVGRVPPLGLEVAGQGVGLGIIDVAGGEGNNVVTDGVQTLELRGKVDGAGSRRGPAEVEAGDTNGVTGSNNTVLLLIPKNPGEHAIKVLGGIKAVLLILVYISISTLIPIPLYPDVPRE